ncbi:uridine nucleosidase [Thelephora ganbajun]|uniref:Uridine nucleosidase n=1 Tax=Thelephora ganbajun TaxID=370292 RepID=A0ACB6ZQB6_THEGA|nr:uridine nucleosidase [Thelephora ganbajun]
MSEDKLRHVWLDVDPGHDDATAIMLALSAPEYVDLLGVSTVHGNSDLLCTTKNAARCLYAFCADKDQKVHMGAAKPLIRHARHDPEIHGVDGLGGVRGLPDANSNIVKSIVSPIKAIDGMAASMKFVMEKLREKVSIVSCGPMTNLALFISVYPELLYCVEEIVFMGGGVGIGNRGAVAEFNVLCDPEAAQIVLNAPVKKTMIPINVTHTAIVTHDIHSKILGGSNYNGFSVPPPISDLRYTLSTLITFFADTYKHTFGFNNGPPLHDALTIAYIAHPEFFTRRRYRVDVELSGIHSLGQTVVDIWNYSGATEDRWGAEGKNCLVAESLDVPKFFQFFLECIDYCDTKSPLNRRAPAPRSSGGLQLPPPDLLPSPAVTPEDRKEIIRD